MEQTNSYEVLSYKNGYWAILSITDSREDAINEAKNCSGGRHTKSIAVLHETTDLNTNKAVAVVIYEAGIRDGIPNPIDGNNRYRRNARPTTSTQHEKPVGPAEISDITVNENDWATDITNQIVKSVLLLGGISLGMLIIMWYFLTHLEEISSRLNALLNGN